MNKTYFAVLFAENGEYVTDFRHCDSIDEVWDKIGNMGSRWIFYPYCFVCEHDFNKLVKESKIVSFPEEFKLYGDITIADLKESFENDYTGRQSL